MMKMERTHGDERCLNDFTQLLNLLLAAANVRVCHVRLFLHLHERDGRVDLGRQGDLNLILVAVDAEHNDE